jgi:polyhydroxyalkanoate synthase
MSESAGIDPASIPERIQLEVQRAIQRSIKGVEYFASSGLALGLTPKDVLIVRICSPGHATPPCVTYPRLN